MTTPQAHTHHYVPQWYQKRFLRAGDTTFSYLDLHPESVTSDSVRHQRRNLLHWGPARCFCQYDLYTLKLGTWTTDEVERHFFGKIDVGGRAAVPAFADYEGHPDVAYDAFPLLVRYMSAQRFRTPRGLDRIKSYTSAPNHTSTLLAMEALFRLYETMWTEGVWEIVRAHQTKNKFLLVDEPVTFFNRRLFPSEIRNPRILELDKVGTRTIFPLGLDSCLIITHTELTRRPRMRPDVPRTNARSYQPAMINLLGIQFGRELEEQEVLRLNYILKRRASRYVAAPVADWLYPENSLSTEWPKLDDDWFLFPNLYKVPFTIGQAAEFRDGRILSLDAYGRPPMDRNHRDEVQNAKEWETHLLAQQEWARKRCGKSIAHVNQDSGWDSVGDTSMQKYLDGLDSR